MNKAELKEQLKELVGRWGGLDKEKAQILTDTDEECKIRLYTNDHCYSIYAKYPKQDEKGYLGCISSTRKPLAGEDWTRGNDLADGGCSKETFNKIVWDILAYELVPLTPKLEPISEGLKASV